MLDANASLESQLRYQYAQEIADLCPVHLFQEIALTGSSARGIATGISDIEINFWVENLPSLEARSNWVHSLNVSDVIAMTEPRPDNSYWINALYHGIELEAGWQTFSDLDTALTRLIEADTTDHKALRLAELVLSAKSLRGFGALEKWQALLQDYPVELADKLIHEALTGWLGENWLENRLNQTDFKADIHRIWRLIFALNHQWEINWKYAQYSLDTLKIYPKNIASCVLNIQENAPEYVLVLLLEIIEETLELIKSNYGLTDTVLEASNHCRLLLAQAKST